MFFPTANPAISKTLSLPPAAGLMKVAAESGISLTLPVPAKPRSRLQSGDHSDEANSDASTDVGTSPKNNMNSKPRKEFVKEFKRK